MRRLRVNFAEVVARHEPAHFREDFVDEGGFVRDDVIDNAIDFAAQAVFVFTFCERVGVQGNGVEFISVAQHTRQLEDVVTRSPINARTLAAGVRANHSS